MYRFLYILFLFAAAGASAQNLPERSAVRQGNRQYNKGEYEKSIEDYQRAVQAAPQSFEAGYNLGNALYKAQRFDQSEQTLQQSAADTLQAAPTRAQAFYNLGNAQFQQKKYQQALESYKQSLRLNPDDKEAKYNYAYTKHLLDQQDKQNKGGGGQNNKDQNKDQNQNQNQNQQGKNDQNKQDQNKQNDQQNNGQNPQNNQGDQQQNPQQQPDNKDKGDGQGQTSPGGISPQEQQQMLDAIQAQEDQTQDKLKKARQGVVVRGTKNW